LTQTIQSRAFLPMPGFGSGNTQSQGFPRKPSSFKLLSGDQAPGFRIPLVAGKFRFEPNPYLSLQKSVERQSEAPIAGHGLTDLRDVSPEPGQVVHYSQAVPVPHRDGAASANGHIAPTDVAGDDRRAK